MDNFSEAPINVQIGSLAGDGAQQGAKLSENIANTISNVWESNKPVIIAGIVIAVGIMSLQDPFKKIGKK